MLPLLGLALTVHDLIAGNAVSIGPVLEAVLLGLVAVPVTIFLEIEGELGAGNDSELLVSFLEQTLA
jgi:hypothetical protein